MATATRKKGPVKNSEAKAEEPKPELLHDVKEKAESVLDDVKKSASGLLKKIKSSAEKVGEFAEDATELGKLKLEIRKSENNLQQLFSQTGRRLWELHRCEGLDQIENAFTEEFKQITELQKILSSKKKKAEEITLVE